MTKQFRMGLAAVALATAAIVATPAIAQEGPANTGGAPQLTPPSAGARVEIRKDGPPRVDVQKDNKEAYFAALEKCGAMKVVPEKQRCVNDAKREYGQM